MANELKGKEGGCLCGRIRYRLEDDPMFVQSCHCTDCQRATGSAFVTNMWIEEDKVTLLGEKPTSIKNTSGSGAVHEVFRCEKCGTNIYSKYHASIGTDIMVRAGTLDDTPVVEPMAHVFVRSKQPWVQLPDDKPQFEEFYSPSKIWPESSRARLMALIETARASQE